MEGPTTLGALGPGAGGEQVSEYQQRIENQVNNLELQMNEIKNLLLQNRFPEGSGGGDAPSGGGAAYNPGQQANRGAAAPPGHLGAHPVGSSASRGGASSH